jgi:hypothetical protein
MTELKPIYTGYQPTGKEPDELHPPTGGTSVQKPLSIDGQPLSTKQLHELITSQALTIERLYSEVWRYRAALKEIAEYPYNNFYVDCGIRVIAEKVLK